MSDLLYINNDDFNMDYIMPPRDMEFDNIATDANYVMLDFDCTAPQNYSPYLQQLNYVPPQIYQQKCAQEICNATLWSATLTVPENDHVTPKCKFCEYYLNNMPQNLTIYAKWQLWCDLREIANRNTWDHLDAMKYGELSITCILCRMLAIMQTY